MIDVEVAEAELKSEAKDVVKGGNESRPMQGVLKRRWPARQATV